MFKSRVQAPETVIQRSFTHFILMGERKKWELRFFLNLNWITNKQTKNQDLISICSAWHSFWDKGNRPGTWVCAGPQLHPLSSVCRRSSCWAHTVCMVHRFFPSKLQSLPKGKYSSFPILCSIQLLLRNTRISQISSAYCTLSWGTTAKSSFLKA